ncbi:PTS system sorbose subfamily IIB component [Enterococcus malodoratus]|nr:PTS sugar transporter subunit IIB [Enterococcus malodoratus]SES95330.1 PTS system sorbose subfamily IIB component [Enterococcus malodoratus]
MSIVLARIDDRLIHGQVMTSWLNYTGANRIIIVDDETANDTFLKMIVTSVAPANIKQRFLVPMTEPMRSSN